MSSAPEVRPREAPGPVRRRLVDLFGGFARRHLFDYNAAATRRWLALATGGALAAAWAFAQLVALPWIDLAQVLIGIGCVVLAAFFQVHIPRTKYSIGVADVFVFGLLALHGAPAAAIAAGAEGLVGGMRSSKRLSSRVSTPAAATAAMAVCGLAFEALEQVLTRAGWPTASVGLAALCAIALPYFAGTTLPLLAVMAAKKGERLSLRDWAEQYSWWAAIYLIAAAVAGVLTLNTRQFGPTVLVVAVTVVAAVVMLARLSLRRRETEFQAQETRVSQAERESALNLQRFSAAFTHAAIGMAIVRHDGSIHQVNLALCALLGSPEAELLNRPFTALLHSGDRELLRRRAAASPGGADEAFSIELRCRAAAGPDTWVSLHCSRFTDPAHDPQDPQDPADPQDPQDPQDPADPSPPGQPSALIYQLHDITSRRLAEGTLHHVAYHDSLTDLANRNCFNERLGVAVERSRTDATQGFAVMFLDLDRFKLVNDSLGHIAGNLLLREVARRLADCVRPGDLVARLGGDEFAVLLEHVCAPDAALALAQRLLDVLAAPMVINGTELMPSGSIGVTLSDLGYRTADEVLRDADLAMYAAKADGRHRVVLFDQSMHERIAEKLKLEGDLRRAIGEGQLSVVYQPLFDLDPYRLSGFEALARWKHPERGPISPDVFIALAEEGGHIEALTAWVIDQAAGQLAQWRAACPQMLALGMHVNISGRDLMNAALVPLVREVLARHALPAPLLTLEITETSLMGDLALALVALNALREVGVKFSIDDFGTGYSSLAYLSTLPIDSLKIDRSFVIGMHEQPQNIEIVRAVLMLGRSLGKKVIAEGIETAEQLATLKGIGVPVGQGYLLSRPLRPDQVPALFDQMLAQAA